MVSEKFRHQLRQEASCWRDEALISSDVFGQLSDRYQFEQLDTVARNRFVLVLLGLGSLLLGLAAITFVAANWQAWSRWSRVLLMMSLFVGVNSGGFALWRDKRHPGRSRLGQALLLLGGLLIGANIGLFSQMFHQTGNIHELFLIWGLAVLAMAYSLRLTALGVLAMVLVMQGDFVALPTDAPSLWNTLLHYFPLLSLVLFGPLADWCRSRWLAGLTLVFVGVVFEVDMVRAIATAAWSEQALAPVFMVAATCLLPLLLWAYRDCRWPHLAPNLAVVYLSLWSSIFAFHGWWETAPSLNTATFDPDLLAPLANLGGFSLLTLALWWQLGQRQSQIWRIELTSTAFGLVVLSLGGLLLWHSWAGPLAVLAPLWINAVLVLLAIALLREALGSGQRRGFWWGTMLLVVQIMARMLEYDTGLLAKALVLFICGVGIIIAGLWFERYVRRLEPSPLKP